MEVDTDELVREVIPALLAYGRRTLQEQCVTSATFTACRWQKGIPAVDVAEIDSDLAEVIRPARGNAPNLTMGQLVVMARSNPNSNFSKLTGNRWPVMLGATPRDFARAYGAQNGMQMFLDIIVQPILEKMQASRHSSTHFLQTGVTPIIREGLKSPFYRYNAAFGTRREQAAMPNQLNELDPDQLGGMTIDLLGDDCIVVGSNDVGEATGGSNPVLAAKHREALIKYGTAPLEAAIAQEVADGYAELDRRMELGWKMKYPQWS